MMAEADGHLDPAERGALGGAEEDTGLEPGNVVEGAAPCGGHLICGGPLHRCGQLPDELAGGVAGDAVVRALFPGEGVSRVVGSALVPVSSRSGSVSLAASSVAAMFLASRLRSGLSATPSGGSFKTSSRSSRVGPPFFAQYSSALVSTESC